MISQLEALLEIFTRSRHWRATISGIGIVGYALTFTLSGASFASTNDEWAWLVFYSRDTAEEAESLASQLRANVPNVHVWRAKSGVYAVALGPGSLEAVRDLRKTYLGDGTVPSDSYVSHGDCCVERVDVASTTQQSGDSAGNTPPAANEGKSSDTSAPIKVVLSCRVTKTIMGTVSGKPANQWVKETLVFSLSPMKRIASMSNSDYDLTVSDDEYAIVRNMPELKEQFNIDRTTGSISGIGFAKDDKRPDLFDFMLQWDGQCSSIEDKKL
ncbi:hypothetical protein [Mesorhizobium sp. M1365]|uniref:hypothetical protein n=1 Tax=Mesorhizobium sp. M1365 TaxID=2957090 RepID=UPI003334E036